VISGDTAAALAAAVNEHSLATVRTRRALVDEHGALRLARYVPSDAAWSLDSDTAAFHTTARPYVVHEIGVFGASRAQLAWAEGEAADRIDLAPVGARVVLQSTVLEEDKPGRQLLDEAGYAVARAWSHLAVELDAPPVEPAWPQGISVRPFDQERQWPAAGAALDEAFIDHWGYVPVGEDDGDEGEADDDSGEDDPYSNSRDFCFIAWADEAVAGVLLGNERTVEWAETGKVGSVTVRRPFRRRGLATALLLHAFAAFHRRGIQRVVTDTDADSFTAGPALYERVGMRQFRRELVYERELRSGRELRALEPPRT
jgi:ribosomal protein S18 acetylase RimI-like enzyme